ncbi:hypothetical protein BJX66DRAFT_262329 [Aspergillus keveii]|uniref:Uncharacterized protein n=1 Tax=Aspergillus keveii TaxID=714993 RepID=A0ABR4FYK1_9EURO
MSYERSDIDAVYILHYKSTDLDVFTAQDEEYPFFQYEDHAEIILSYASSSQSDANDLIRMTLHLMHDTRLCFDDDAKKALIFESISCIGHTHLDDGAHPSSERSRICGWNSSSTHSNTQRPRKRNSGHYKPPPYTQSTSKSPTQKSPSSKIPQYPGSA